MKQYHVFEEYSNGSTKALDMILGIKYYAKKIKEDNKERINMNFRSKSFDNSYNIYKTDYPLSLGYAVEEGIKDVNLNTYDVFYVYNNLLKSMTGIQEDVYVKEKDIEKTTNNLEQTGSEYTKINDNARLIVKFKVKREEEIYIDVFSANRSIFTLYCNGENMGDYMNMTYAELIDLGKKEKGEEIILEFEPKDDKMTLDFINIAYESENALKRHYDALKDEQLDMVKISNSHYKGTIDIKEENKYLFLSIPYDEGWTIKVDGKERKALKVVDDFMMIQLDEGKHEIEMNYTVPRN